MSHAHVHLQFTLGRRRDGGTVRVIASGDSIRSAVTIDVPLALGSTIVERSFAGRLVRRTLIAKAPSAERRFLGKATIRSRCNSTDESKACDDDREGGETHDSDSNDR